MKTTARPPLPIQDRQLPARERGPVSLIEVEVGEILASPCNAGVE